MSDDAVAKDEAAVRGRFKIAIEEDGRIVAESDWHENQITNTGFQYGIVSQAGGIAGGSAFSYLALGSGGYPAAGDTALAGEVQKRQSLTAAVLTTKTLNMTGTFLSTNSFVTVPAGMNISNIGLFPLSVPSSLYAGNTYASSSCATNQNVNVTYQLIWS